ncbi:serine protease [Undibacterium sp. Jales W-56]|uniref:S1C family serine protease n=1 Tax=Undibacterium sp. Jales W-56 TaxID=2897325 RepID=UPI0021D305E6|nr:serine protease [Undibacterium sp. Jales W-56]MCU6434105.1 serine protease [Undibacterium sp. Jales W-56]
MKNIFRNASFVAILSGLFTFSYCYAEEFINTVKAVKPSVVAIGTFKKTRSPAVSFTGTGFIVGDGLTVITNAHVVNGNSSLEVDETIGILTGKDDTAEFRPAVVLAVDEEHDLARLKISGNPLPALALGNPDKVTEGQPIAFTGFPLGAALGFHHATHRGIVSSITPVARPAQDSRRLDPKVIAQLRKAAYSVFQLDATAYPGNSGSPVYEPETGAVIGVINMVFVKGLKETAITNPSGISYAIPVNYVSDLLKKKN